LRRRIRGSNTGDFANRITHSRACEQAGTVVPGGKIFFRFRDLPARAGRINEMRGTYVFASAAKVTDGMQLLDRSPSTSLNIVMSEGAPLDRKEEGEAAQAWMRAVAESRDRAAFARLFDRFAPRIKAYLKRLGTLDAQAEDIVQDVMLTVWNRAPQYDPLLASVTTWIFTIARNRRIDLVRRERRPEPDPTDPCFAVDGPIDPEENLRIVQGRSRIHAVLAELPKEQARLIALSFFDDKPHGAIAAETGLPLGTVKSRLRLALSRLRVSIGASS
jgi:RNA polymerase sigma-70 factor, ECF subfamily